MCTRCGRERPPLQEVERATIGEGDFKWPGFGAGRDQKRHLFDDLVADIIAKGRRELDGFSGADTGLRGPAAIDIKTALFIHCLDFKVDTL